MATVTIRNLPEDIRDKLRIRAARAGRSMEAEARRILTEVLNPSVPGTEPEELQEMVSRLYGGQPPADVVDEFIREKRKDAINEVIADGFDPAVFFGDEFVRICREAGLDADDVRKTARRRAG